jgi:hypothetical protein
MDHDRTHAHDDPARGRDRGSVLDPGAVGRSAPTDDLVGGRGPMPSGLSPAGDALPDALRGQFEASLGHDLGHVRVHTGSASAAAAEAVNARAFALGNNIHFGAGEYDPGSADGQRLIAHEAVHTVQQAGAAPRAQFKLAVSSPGDAHEVEADALADQMVAARPVTAGPMAVAAGVARKPVTAAARGIYRWAAGNEYGFRRYTEAPGVKENPKDPWLGGPQNYNAAVAPAAVTPGDAPADIDAGPMKTGSWPEPLNGIGANNKDVGLPPRTVVLKATDAIKALHGNCDGAVINHNALGAKIRDYATAADQIKPGGALGPAPEGLNWGKPSSGPKDLGSVTDRQRPIGSSTSIGETFHGNQVAGIGDKTIAAARQGTASELLVKARNADEAVVTAVDAHARYIREDIKDAASAVVEAARGLEMIDEQQKSAEAGEKKDDLTSEKNEAVGIFQMVVGGMTKIAALAAAPDKGAMAKDQGKAGLLFLAEKVITEQFDDQIKAQEAIVKNVRVRLRALDRARGAAGLAKAEETLSRVSRAIAPKRVAVRDALTARQAAYDAAAAETKKQAIAPGADPQAGAPYADRAGLAYAVGRGTNAGIAAFERALATMKGHAASYGAERDRWAERLASAQQVAFGANVTATEAD